MFLLEKLKKEAEKAGEAKVAGEPVDPAVVATELTGSDPTSPLNQVDTVANTSANAAQAAIDIDENSIPAMIDEIFRTAADRGASDIHFKPSEDYLKVFLRVDGSMVLHKTFEKIYHHPLIARIKIISGLRIDERRLPQDGKSTFQTSKGADVDLRVSILPTQYGEKVVIRLLEKNPKMIELRDLGMLPTILSKIEKKLQSSYGMI